MVARTDRRSSPLSEDIGDSHKPMIRLLSRAYQTGDARLVGRIPIIPAERTDAQQA